MNKIICDVCGTDYPETAAQCPICGCASAGAQTSAGNEAADTDERAAHAPVRGGRYSKANVRKRLKASQIPYVPMPESEPEPEYEDDEEQEEVGEAEEEGSNRGLIVVVVILLLAIVAVASYIAISMFDIGFDKPDNSDSKPGTSQTAPTTEPSTATTPVATGTACTELSLSDVDIYLKNVGSIWKLTATPVPADTTDEVVFTSTDEDVVTVDEFGLVTAVGTGKASIIVTCGDVVVDCPVQCGDNAEATEPTDPTDETDPTDPTDETDPTDPTEAPDDFVLKLKKKDFTLTKNGETYKLYDGEVDAADITWTSDDEEVVTIEKGIVTAVGNGRTRVYGEYGDQKVSCWVSCKLPEEQATQPTEPEDEEAGAYKLMVNGHVSPYGDEYNAEVTITVGEDFRLTVEDDAGVRQSVTWKASKEGICSVDGRTVTGESKGRVTLTATIGDQTYTCVILVK